MTPNIYTDIFKDVGRNYNDYIEVKNLSPIYRVNYYDGSSYDFYSSQNEMIRSLENIENGISKSYFDLIDESLKKYLISKKYFLDKPMTNINEVFNIKSMEKLVELNAITTASDYIKSKISNKKLQEYLLFKTMYIGVDPYNNSNLYTLIPAISQSYGFIYIKGGFYSYIKALEKLIVELGGRIEVDNEALKVLVDRDSVVAVKAKRGTYKANIVICNADYSYAIEKLFDQNIREFNYNSKNVREKEYSCSVFMIYLGLRKKYNTLKVHNIYINEDFKNNIRAAFKGDLPQKPSLYIYSPSAVDNSLCEEGKSVVNIIVRVPNLSQDKINWDGELIKNFRNTIIDAVKNINGLRDIEENIEYEDYLTPEDLKNKFNAYYGNAFGLSHKITQSAYMRAHMKSREVKGLYYIGSSTHPGNGVSVLIDGSRVLKDLIVKDFNN